MFPFPTRENPHPCVILSPDRIIASQDLEVINILPCQSLRGRDKAKIFEVILDQSDGMVGPTIVKCNIIHVTSKHARSGLCGEVTPERQQAIKRKLVEIFGLFVN